MAQFSAKQNSTPSRVGGDKHLSRLTRAGYWEQEMLPTCFVMYVGSGSRHESWTPPPPPKKNSTKNEIKTLVLHLYDLLYLNTPIAFDVLYHGLL